MATDDLIGERKTIAFGRMHVDQFVSRTGVLQQGVVHPVTHGHRQQALEERFLLRRDCPAFAPGSWNDRPGVPTPHQGLALAGDFVRLPIPSALMERAVASGFLAANHLLAPQGVRPEPIWSIPRRGLFGRRPAETAESRMR